MNSLAPAGPTPIATGQRVGARLGSDAVVGRFLVDGHVHFHDCYDEAVFLAAAHANLSRFGSGLPTLLLAEMQGVNVFARWQSGDVVWPVTPTGERESLLLGERLLVVAGRQIVTAERIEVLALLTTELFDDGSPLDHTLERVQACGAIAVLPWGVGKWLGERGRRVAEAVSRHGVLLGDNAGRPPGWPRPRLFRNHPTLPGSDPLRLKSQERMVGTYGFEVSCGAAARQPAEALRSVLRSLQRSPSVLGGRVTPPGFVRQQLGLRLMKGRSAA